MNKQTKVYTVNTAREAEAKIQDLANLGYNRDHLYVLAHDKKRTEHIAEQAAASEIGVSEEGVFTAIANLFRSHGDELRAKMTSMGVSMQHAEMLERELDKGKIVIFAWSGTPYDGDRYDPDIIYYPPFL